MSLRSRILWLFIVFAVVPLLALAAFSYFYGSRLVEEALRQELIGSADHLGAALLEWKDEAEGALTGFQNPEGNLERISTSNSFEEIERRLSSVGPVVYVLAQNTHGEPIWQVGSLAPDSVQCGPSGRSRILEVRVRTTSDELLSAGYWTSDVIDNFKLPSGVLSLIADVDSGEILYTGSCGGPDAGAAPWLGEMLTNSRKGEDAGQAVLFSNREGGRRQMAAFKPLPEVGLAVVITARSSPAFLPLAQIHLFYWLFVLVLTLSTSVAFSLSLRKVTRSLKDLTRAAEEIGRGELHPELPVPGKGEVGRLTHAFNRMSGQIQDVMAQVEQSGRLAVVGQLSAYLAHEIRNPLSSIKLNLQRLKRWSESGQLPEVSKVPLDISLREVDRLSSAVSGVLQLARPRNQPRQNQSLHQVVLESRDLLLERFRKQGVGVELSLDANQDQVLSRPGQLKGIILNLMVNALEAQPHGGNLEIRSELEEREGTGEPWIWLRFKDRGPGVLTSLREDIFEPFFSTKKTGSGIGLAVARQSVQENGGRLFLEQLDPSSPGAEFVVALPLEPIRASDRVRYGRDEPGPGSRAVGSWRSKARHPFPQGDD